MRILISIARSESVSEFKVELLISGHGPSPLTDFSCSVRRPPSVAACHFRPEQRIESAESSRTDSSPPDGSVVGPRPSERPLTELLLAVIVQCVVSDLTAPAPPLSASRLLPLLRAISRGNLDTAPLSARDLVGHRPYSVCLQSKPWPSSVFSHALACPPVPPPLFSQ